jgi:small subunit ribosomal protein S11
MGRAVKKKIKKISSKGVAHVKATFNNTLVTITPASASDLAGSAGHGVQGHAQEHAVGAQRAAEKAAASAMRRGPEVEVRVKGRLGPRIRGPRAGELGLKVLSIEDVTPPPLTAAARASAAACRSNRRESRSQVQVAAARA